jgi:hypothetical protein
VQNEYVDSLDSQFAILRSKGCGCAVANDEKSAAHEASKGGQSGGCA